MNGKYIFLILAGFAVCIPGAWKGGNINAPGVGIVFAQNTSPEKTPPPSLEENDVPGPVQLPSASPGINPETFRLIEMIEKKNKELKRREEELLAKEKRLNTLQENIRRDLKKIEDAIAKSQEQIGIQQNLIKENVRGLVKAYSNMKANEAAKLLAAINEDLAIQIISGMKSKVAGKVLSALDVKVAKNISEKMAGKRKAAK